MTLNNPTIEQIINYQSNSLVIDGIVTIAVIKEITKSKIIERLYIKNIDYIGDESAIILSKSKSIEDLYINNNNITDVGAIALSTSKSLKYLSIGSNSVGDPGAIALSKSRLIGLNIAKNNITNVGAMELTKSNIRILDMYGNNITCHDNTTYIRINYNSRTFYTEFSVHNALNWSQKYMIL